MLSTLLTFEEAANNLGQEIILQTSRAVISSTPRPTEPSSHSQAGLRDVLAAQKESVQTERLRIEAILGNLRFFTKRLRFHEEMLAKRVSPIDTVPPEILEKIIGFTTTPQSTKQTLHLTKISTLWRTVTSSLSHLFIEANWVSWHPSLVQLWCRRAEMQNLRIDLWSVMDIQYGLKRRTPKHLPDGYCDKLVEVLIAALSHAHELCIGLEAVYEMDVVKALLAQELPELRKLDLYTISINARQEVELDIPCPNLRELSIDGFCIHTRSFLPSLILYEHTGLCGGIHTGTWRRLFGPGMTSSPMLQELTIEDDTKFTLNGGIYTLNHLRKLTISNFDAPTVQSMLERLELPSIEMLAIRIWYGKENGNEFSDMMTAIPKSTAHLRLHIGVEDLLFVPLTVVMTLVADGVVPKLTHLEYAFDGAKWAKEQELQEAFEDPILPDFEDGLILLSEQRKVPRLTLPVLSSTCIATLSEDYGVTAEAFYVQPLPSFPASDP
ncbi:hypothetical protein DL93DRAFT_2170916 [Clavulina sp. PMI_390]|nr:hypothetical protein DL93DRAFT_2170916 [Clavulina sp. PMI_390]